MGGNRAVVPATRNVVRTRLIFPAVALTAVALQADDRLGLQPGDGQVARLVEELGSEQFVVRSRAEESLIRHGVAAFDALKAAEGHPDLEIAARATYLTQLVVVPWVPEGAPEDVQEILRGYGGLSGVERARQIRALALLADDAGVESLCRIARFENGPLLSRAAALAVIEPETMSPRRDTDARSKQLDDAVSRGLGRSSRSAARWLRAMLVSQQDPQAGLAQWHELAEQERRVLAENPSASRREFVDALMRRQLALLRVLGRHDEAVAVAVTMVDPEPDESSRLVELVCWLIRERAWAVVDSLARRFPDRFHSQAVLCYALAQVRSAQGNSQSAEVEAARAFRLHEGEPEPHFASAVELEMRGLFPWAEREYRYLLDLDPPTAASLVLAGNRLSLMLHDQGQELQAAQVLRGTIARMDAILAKGRTRPGSQPDRAQAVCDSLRARMEFYLAAHNAQAENWAAQREHLDQAIRCDPLDADVLIAMYRSPGADAAYRAQTQTLIHRAAGTFRQRIQESPRDATPLNQLAWLVSNTEGDLDEALAASRQSLKLEPGLAGYLDTLAHCYYAKKDYARAVRVQSQADSIEPHTRAIRRQLERFERAWDESRRGRITESQNATGS